MHEVSRPYWIIWNKSENLITSICMQSLLLQNHLMSANEESSKEIEMTRQTDQPAAKEKIARLVQNFHDVLEKHRVAEISEQDTITKFIRPMLEALGWDFSDFEEVREEVHVPYANLKADCVFYVNGRPRVVFEFKGLGAGRLDHKDFDFERLLDMVEDLGTGTGVLTNFRETEVHVFSDKWKETEFGVDEYEKKFDDLWMLLSRQSRLRQSP